MEEETDRELYKVWVFYPGGYHTDETDWVDVETAQKKVISLIQNVGARIGTTEMIRIVDLGDNTVFQWEFGKGVTYPPLHGSSSVQT